MQPTLTSLRIACLFFLGSVAAHAVGDAVVTPEQQRVYDQRADKIVVSLSLADKEKAAYVRETIAAQYLALNAIHTKRDARIKNAKEEHAGDKTAVAAEVTAARDEAEEAQNHLQAAYLENLSADLTPAQIDQVKDGMTYGVLPLTYRVYQEMLPNLTNEQKAQILAWLTEAREHAMSGSTSEEKHAWFGKYKGKINNYLAAAGIDMKKAEKEMTQRRKAPGAE